MKFERITIDPKVCTGKACIRGPAISGITPPGPARLRRDTAIRLESASHLELADIAEALRYAAWLAEDEAVELA
jgi:uncharacterized protein (DUF433 family)